MKKILISLFVLALLGAAYGIYKYVEPTEKSMEYTRADIIISADQLIKEYETDENKANEKYLGKVIEVNGKVSEITNEDGKKKVSLETSNPMSTIDFDFDESVNTGVLNKGDNVKLKGKCTGYLGYSVILNQSSIAK